MGGVSLQKRDPPSLLPPHTAETCCKTAMTMTHCRALEGEKRGREDDRDRVTSGAPVREVFILTVVGERTRRRRESFLSVTHQSRA